MIHQEYVDSIIYISMEKIDFNSYIVKKQEKPYSERASIVKEFIEILNNSRKPPFKPLTPARIGMLLSPIKTKDLYSFLADCKNAKNFSSYFWWSCDKSKHNQS